MIVNKTKNVKPFWSSLPYHRELKVLLSPKIHGTSPQLSIGVVTIPPGESGNRHLHHTEQETWYILSGEGKLIIGHEEINLEPEMVVVAYAGEKHQIKNTGNEPLKALFIFTPAGPEENFIICE